MAKKRGRPPKWKPEYVDQAHKLALLGLTDVEIAQVFDVSEKTLNNWKKKKPDFLQSLKRGKMLADAEVSMSLYKRARGYTKTTTRDVKINDEVRTLNETKHYPPDSTAIIFWLKNRQPEKWRDKQEVASSMTTTREIVFANEDEEES